MARPTLVTGAAGFIGRHLVSFLAQEGSPVVGVDTAPAYGERPGVEAERLGDDFATEPVLADVASGRFAAVVHLAAVVDTTTRDVQLVQRENTDKALMLAAAARASRTRFVYASSSSVYGSIRRGASVREQDVYDRAVCSGPLNPYAASKAALDEGMTEKYRKERWFWAGLRFTNVFGDGEVTKGRMASILYQIASRVACERSIELFEDTVDAARDYVPVEVVVKHLAAVASGEGGTAGIYNLGSGTATSFGELIAWFEVFAHRRLVVDLVPNPYASAYQYWTCVDMSKWNDGLGATITWVRPDVRRAACELLARHSSAERVASTARRRNGHR